MKDTVSGEQPLVFVLLCFDRTPLNHGEAAQRTKEQSPRVMRAAKSRYEAEMKSIVFCGLPPCHQQTPPSYLVKMQSVVESRGSSINTIFSFDTSLTNRSYSTHNLHPLLRNKDIQNEPSKDNQQRSEKKHVSLGSPLWSQGSP